MNTPTTPTSVASQLTDEEIEHLIDVCDKDADRHEREANVARRYDRCDSMRELNEYAKDERLTAAVLRDYMRLRSIENRIDSAINKTKQEGLIMGRSTNALAELAKGIRVISLWVDSKYENILGKAQRIVAVLAKVDSTYVADPVHNNICNMAYDALVKIREIAEGGEVK